MTPAEAHELLHRMEAIRRDIGSRYETYNSMERNCLRAADVLKEAHDALSKAWRQAGGPLEPKWDGPKPAPVATVNSVWDAVG